MASSLWLSGPARHLFIERGAQVRISTDNAEAVKVIHEFLLFQIQDHRTGDAVEVEKKPSS
jgi:hypothetical protein